VPFEDTPYNTPNTRNFITGSEIENAIKPQYQLDAEAARIDLFDTLPDRSISYLSNEAATYATPGRMEVEIESQPETAEFAPYGLAEIQNASKNLVCAARPNLRREDYVRAA